MQTKKLIYEMLKENTGIHMMDSGGGANRGWQKNEAKTLKDFENESEVVYHTSKYDEYYTISVFHYLTKQLELDGLCEDFNAIPNKDWKSDIYGVSKKGEKWLKATGFEVKDSFNTYNGESFLSQIVQGTYLESLNGEDYVLIQIHGGCDARGGYTDAKLFKLGNGVGREWLNAETVYGNLTKKSGKVIQIENTHDGVNLTTEDGKEIKIAKSDKIELWLSD